MKDKNKFDKLQQEQRDLDASYRQSLQKQKGERIYGSKRHNEKTKQFS